MIVANPGTVLPPRREHDFYKTPLQKVIHGLEILKEDLQETKGRDMLDREFPKIFDPGAGDGAWGEVCRDLWPKAFISGCDLREIGRPFDYNEWRIGDFTLLETPAPGGVDLVVGNPPYSDAEMFVRRSLWCLKPGGRLIFLLRLAFLESVGRAEGLFREFPLKKVVVCARRPSFYQTKKSKTNATSFAFFLWQKGYEGETRLSWK